MNNNIFIKSLVIAALLLMIPLISIAEEEIFGQIIARNSRFYQGIDPIDNQDPLINDVDHFVLLKANGVYYFMPNFPRKLKIKYYKNQVKIEGDIGELSRHIDIKTVSVIMNGKSKKVWKSNRKLSIDDDIYGGGP